MEPFIRILIIAHAISGGIALVAGLPALIAKKGGLLHRRSGAVFFYAMLACGLSALIIAVLPGHYNAFLFAVGIFSLYFVVTGYRALSFRKPQVRLVFDKIVAWVMIVAGVNMMVVPIVWWHQINIVMAVFAVVGMVFAIRDLLLFGNRDRLRSVWLKLHLGKMLGGYIAATTAFVVVNQVLPGIVGWLLPGVLGGVLIAFWLQKVDRMKKPSKDE